MKILKEQNVKNISVKEVIPEDKRIKLAMEITDDLTHQKFAILACTKKDIDNLLPQLIQTLYQIRDSKALRII